MNEFDIERELKKLRPAAPSPDLEERIAGDLAAFVPAPPVTSRAARARLQSTRDSEESRASWFTIWLDRLLWSGAGAAVAAVALVILQKPQIVQPASSSGVASHEVVPREMSALQPVLGGEEAMGWRDEGVQFDAHGQPMLKMSRTAVERQAWADLENGGVIQMEKPRQETIWVPVNLH